MKILSPHFLLPPLDPTLPHFSVTSLNVQRERERDDSEEEVLPRCDSERERDDLRGMLEFLLLNQPSQVQVRAKYEEDRNLGFQKLGNFK